MSVIYYHSLPAIKKYLRPGTINEAVLLLAEYGKDARILSGGTDLIVLMRSRKLAPKYVLDIKGIQGLDEIKLENNYIKIGANTTLRQVETSTLVQKNCSLLKDAITQMANIQIKNMGTVVGNICRASPAADCIPPLLVLEASVEVAGPDGSKFIELDKFFSGPGTTILRPFEIVTDIRIPKSPKNTVTSFFRITRVAADLAKVNGAVMIIHKDDVCTESRIALGGVAPTAIRTPNAERFLNAKKLNNETIEQTASLAAAETLPISDVRSSMEYRREMCRVLVTRALKTCTENITNGDI